MLTRRFFASGALSVIAGAAGGLPAAAQSGFRWPGGAQAAVSLTYDDGLDSQVDYAAPDLRAAGLKGTFFLTKENMLARTADWQSVNGLGHEMANHSVSHPCNLKHCTSALFRQDEIAPMEAFLDEAFGSPGRFRCYAYPCGFVAMGRGTLHQRIARYEVALKGEVVAARTVSGLANESVLRATRDLDGDGMLPPDFSLSRDLQSQGSTSHSAFRAFVRYLTTDFLFTAPSAFVQRK